MESDNKDVSQDKPEEEFSIDQLIKEMEVNIQEYSDEEEFEFIQEEEDGEFIEYDEDTDDQEI